MPAATALLRALTIRDMAGSGATCGTGTWRRPAADRRPARRARWTPTSTPGYACSRRLASGNDTHNPRIQRAAPDLARAYEKETGHTVVLTFGTMGVVRQKLASDPADVVIMSDTVIEDALARGAVAPGSRTDIARTGMGVGVRDGAPRPDISSVDAFTRALLAAKSIVYVDPAQGATSGVHFASVLQKLGIADAVKPRTTLVPGGYPAELVARGEVELVVHQISEIVSMKGVTLVGPLPREIQKVTVYAAGLAAKSSHADLGRGFMAFLARPAFKPKFAEAGLDYKE